MPDISVVVPVYNTEKYLRRCVESIMRQSFADFDLILVDDGSPDNSGAICDEYAEKDIRIKVIHQKNGGLSAARNTGIEYALDASDSEWITFIDSDDYVNENLLETLLKSAVDAFTDISASGFTFFEKPEDISDFDARIIKPATFSPEEFYTERRTEATVAWGKLYKKELFRNERYPVGKLHEDEFVTYRLLFSQTRISFTDAPLYYYYRNPGGIMLGAKSLRTDKTEAFTEQTEYFRQNGFHKAEKVSARALFVGCAQELRGLIEGPPADRRLIRTMRRILRNTKIRYRLDTSLVGGNRSYLSLAHPHIDDLRIKAKHALIGIKKVLHA